MSMIQRRSNKFPNFALLKPARTSRKQGGQSKASKSLVCLPAQLATIWSDNIFAGITNQRETAVAWSRKTGKPLCRAIVWTDSRTKNHVVFFEKRLREVGLNGKKGNAGVNELREL